MHELNNDRSNLKFESSEIDNIKRNSIDVYLHVDYIKIILWACVMQIAFWVLSLFVNCLWYVVKWML